MEFLYGGNFMNFILLLVGLVITTVFVALSFDPARKLQVLGIVVGIGVIIFSQAFVIIPTGYTGVRTTLGQIDNITVPNGFNWKIPLIQSIRKVNNKQQDITITDQIWSESSEQVQLYYSDITITYQINPEKSAWIYANVSNYEDSLITGSIISSAIKTSSKQVTAAEATNRGVIEPIAKEEVQKALDEKYGENVVLVNKITISDANFEDAYNQAIADRQTAQLAYEKQQIENKQAVEKAAADAEVKKTQAEADAQATIIKAESEAKANQMLEESLSDNILKEMYIEKWNGEMPKVTSDSGTMVDIGSITE